MKSPRFLAACGIRFFLPLGLAVSLGGCTPTAVPPKEGGIPLKTPIAATPAGQNGATIPAAIASLNGFSLKVYGQVAKQQQGNLAVSPLGSFILLQMLFEGSVGPAHDEMATLLGFSPTSLAEVGSLVDQLDALESLSLAQKIYVDEKAHLVEAYLEKVGPLLAEPVQVLPFSADPEAAVQVINDWVELKTKGVIKDFLSPLSPQTVSVLVSALHFQGKWAYQFPKQVTAPAAFTPADGEPYQVSMMSAQVKGLNLLSFPKGRGVILPYTDDVEMVFLLPDQGSAPDDLWGGVDPSAGLGKEVSPQGPPVIVDLPRFRFEVPTFELTESWKNVGLKVTVDGPDLSPMLSVDPPMPMSLTVFHKTYVKVDEEGTEAAAATAATMRLGSSARKPSPQRIRFDRPFGFLLRHSKTGAILMLGRVERPDPAAD